MLVLCFCIGARLALFVGFIFPSSTTNLVFRCIIPAGVGVGYRWVVTVGGQASLPSTQTTSFSPPVVSLVELRLAGGAPVPLVQGVPTAGGATLVLSGTNFGPVASLVRVLWNGVPVPGVRFEVAHSVLVVPTLPGAGRHVNVTLVVGEQGALWTASAMDAVLSYSPPAILAMSIQREANDVSMDCSRLTPDGRPLSSAVLSATLVLEGEHFGAGGSTTVHIRDTVCDIVSVSHDKIVCNTALCQGLYMLERAHPSYNAAFVHGSVGVLLEAMNVVIGCAFIHFQHVLRPLLLHCQTAHCL